MREVCKDKTSAECVLCKHNQRIKSEFYCIKYKLITHRKI